ncbi:MAG: formylglycine-generating enzyme family protein [Planctomycetia bacterium]|nr:formylglycine-generating enzyme family protein [Planctomycetia bacterium]
MTVQNPDNIRFLIPSSAGERIILHVQEIEFPFRWCPAGEFSMGSPSSEKGRTVWETRHRVTLSRGFWILETEVTQSMWETVMGITIIQQAEKMLHDDTVYDFNNGKRTIRELHHFSRDQELTTLLCGLGSDYPVYYVNWLECMEFCQKLSATFGVTFQLPTEAQWEYACRAGTQTPIYNGTSKLKDFHHVPRLDTAAWYSGNSMQEFTQKSFSMSGKPQILRATLLPGSPRGTHPVGKKLPNAWGLHDMLGNVWEWCYDWFSSYGKTPVLDPTGPENGENRVFRGGGWDYDARFCRCAFRSGMAPTVRNNHLGFRCVFIPQKK